MTSFALCACSHVPVADPASPQHQDGRYRNVVPRQPLGLAKTARLAWTFLTGKPDSTVPDRPIPVQPLSTADLLAAPDASLWRLGHSTVLMKLDGGFWLTDPVFSERASPVQWAGPKRFHAPPIRIEELPPIRGVILSHDHFDHLDADAIRQLAPKVGVFVTPLGVGARLIAWGVDPARVRQLDWWGETQVDGVRLTAVPAQHFSGRSLLDEDRTLWASWVIRSAGLRVFFSGDTGYHADFKTIGERLGPFDLTMIETGAYDAMWADVHMQPEQTLQAHLDLGGRWLMPVHNGTFDLALHPWDEPFERIAHLARERGVPLATPEMGERVPMAAPQAGRPWWVDMAPRLPPVATPQGGSAGGPAKPVPRRGLD